jgi:pimeloyl-ACP methyl ester carboxylesterase
MSAQLCADVQVLKVPDASHWCQQDVPELVNLAIEQFVFTPTGD